MQIRYDYTHDYGSVAVDTRQFFNIIAYGMQHKSEFKRLQLQL
jgi:hypothetical protein